MVVVVMRRRVVPPLVLIASLCIISPPLMLITTLMVVVLTLRRVWWTVVVIHIGYHKGMFLLNLMALVGVMCGARAQTTNSRRAFKLSNRRWGLDGLDGVVLLLIPLDLCKDGGHISKCLG